MNKTMPTVPESSGS